MHKAAQAMHSCTINRLDDGVTSVLKTDRTDRPYGRRSQSLFLGGADTNTISSALPLVPPLSPRSHGGKRHLVYLPDDASLVRRTRLTLAADRPRSAGHAQGRDRASFQIALVWSFTPSVTRLTYCKGFLRGSRLMILTRCLPSHTHCRSLRTSTLSTFTIPTPARNSSSLRPR